MHTLEIRREGRFGSIRLNPSYMVYMMVGIYGWYI